MIDETLDPEDLKFPELAVYQLVSYGVLKGDRSKVRTAISIVERSQLMGS